MSSSYTIDNKNFLTLIKILSEMNTNMKEIAKQLQETNSYLEVINDNINGIRRTVKGLE